MQKFLKQANKIYKSLVSPLLHNLLLFAERGCRYHPTCSQYTLLAIKKYGFIYGTYKGFLRILRCNQLFPGGIDFP